MEIAYLDIASALDNPALAPLLTSNQPMSNIGDSFASWYTFLPVFYTLQMTPSEAYDGLIFVRSATPTTMLEE
jgi:erythromycin esterase